MNEEMRSRGSRDVKEIKAWMMVKKLQLNGDKTRLVLVSALRANAVVSGLQQTSFTFSQNCKQFLYMPL